MMKKNIFLFAVAIIATNVDASSKRLVDCWLVTSKTTECNPYSSKFIYTKDMLLHNSRDKRRGKLIISKTLPHMERPRILRTIRVEDMIENHIEVHEPIRFAKSIHNFTKNRDEADKQTVVAQKDNNTTKKISTIASIDTNKTVTAKLKPTTEQLEREKSRLAKEKRDKLAKLKSKRYPQYTIQKGDTLNSIAKRFNLTTKQITSVNYKLKRTTTLKIGKKISLPISNYKFNLLQKGSKKKRSKLANKLKDRYLHMKKKSYAKTLNEYNKKLVSPFKGKHSLRVQATAYSSHRGQTDKTPFLAAWNNRIRPGMKIIAVSRDLIYKYGLGNGKRVRIQGLPGYYTVRDKMNKRYTKRIDIYMGVNRRKALRWGRRRTVIYW
ncbi:Membrane-bound lytic murein transglycosylase D precursor [hydrothermal vent metagenome]|uniref:Membrane-bound lytic murein transglycosylase D n=1 Tax=hydrothermal vent metagenome TaxID=652676 RepID=A0A1W1BDN7_9ZZZZ